MNERYFRGILEASPEKRYKSFLNKVVDLEQVWIGVPKGVCEDSKNADNYIVLWPLEEFSKENKLSIACVEPMEIHDFLDAYQELGKTKQFMVFPTDRDAYMVTWERLYNDIVEHLEEIE